MTAQSLTVCCSERCSRESIAIIPQIALCFCSHFSTKEERQQNTLQRRKPLNELGVQDGDRVISRRNHRGPSIPFNFFELLAPACFALQIRQRLLNSSPGRDAQCNSMEQLISSFLSSTIGLCNYCYANYSLGLQCLECAQTLTKDPLEAFLLPFMS